MVLPFSANCCYFYYPIFLSGSFPSVESNRDLNGMDTNEPFRRQLRSVRLLVPLIGQLVLTKEGRVTIPLERVRPLTGKLLGAKLRVEVVDIINHFHSLVNLFINQRTFKSPRGAVREIEGQQIIYNNYLDFINIIYNLHSMKKCLGNICYMNI